MFYNKSFLNAKITKTNTQLLVVTGTEAQSNGIAFHSPYTKKAQDKEPQHIKTTVIFSFSIHQQEN